MSTETRSSKRRKHSRTTEDVEREDQTTTAVAAPTTTTTTTATTTNPVVTATFQGLPREVIARFAPFMDRTGINTLRLLNKKCRDVVDDPKFVMKPWPSNANSLIRRVVVCPPVAAPDAVVFGIQSDDEDDDPFPSDDEDQHPTEDEDLDSAFEDEDDAIAGLYEEHEVACAAYSQPPVASGASEACISTAEDRLRRVVYSSGGNDDDVSDCSDIDDDSSSDWRLYYLVFSRDGSRMAVGRIRHRELLSSPLPSVNITIWDRSQGLLGQFEYQIPTGRCMNPAFSPDGDTVLFPSWRNGEIQVFRLPSANQRGPVIASKYVVKGAHEFYFVAFIDNDTIVFKDRKDNSIKTCRIVMSDDGAGQRQPAYSPDQLKGVSFLLEEEDGTILNGHVSHFKRGRGGLLRAFTLISDDSGAYQEIMKYDDLCSLMQRQPNAGQIAIRTPDPETVFFMSTDCKYPAIDYPADNDWWAIAAHSSSCEPKCIMAHSHTNRINPSENAVRIYDMKRSAWIDRDLVSRNVVDMAFSHDGNRLVVASPNSVLSVFECNVNQIEDIGPAQIKALFPPNDHTYCLISVSFLPFSSAMIMARYEQRRLGSESMSQFDQHRNSFLHTFVHVIDIDTGVVVSSEEWNDTCWDMFVRDVNKEHRLPIIG